jgi:hypothetical protein
MKLRSPKLCAVFGLQCALIAVLCSEERVAQAMQRVRPLGACLWELYCSCQVPPLPVHATICTLKVATICTLEDGPHDILSSPSMLPLPVDLWYSCLLCSS